MEPLSLEVETDPANISSSLRPYTNHMYMVEGSTGLNLTREDVFKMVARAVAGLHNDKEICTPFNLTKLLVFDAAICFWSYKTDTTRANWLNNDDDTFFIEVKNHGLVSIQLNQVIDDVIITVSSVVDSSCRRFEIRSTAFEFLIDPSENLDLIRDFTTDFGKVLVSYCNCLEKGKKARNCKPVIFNPEVLKRKNDSSLKN